LERFREVSRESDTASTGETVERNRFAGVGMAHAITREQMVSRLGWGDRVEFGKSDRVLSIQDTGRFQFTGRPRQFG
jgi:hypothetical protein